MAHASRRRGRRCRFWPWLLLLAAFLLISLYRSNKTLSVEQYTFADPALPAGVAEQYQEVGVQVIFAE